MEGKRERLTKYIDLRGSIYLPVGDLPELFRLALEDGVKTLIVTEVEYKIIRLYLLTYGAWNWDGKTIMGMELEII